ncbi:MAG: hypothetical protein JNM68_12645, partial [Dinghuibacter sp.]|nr:hypothetical protein [Dinghuibacter sp.]
MRKILSLLLSTCLYCSVQAQVVEITANPGTSGNIVLGTSNYHATESIYTETELGGATNFVTAGTAINQVGFSINTVGTGTTFGSVNIYMKNVPLASTTFTSGVYTLTGYTLVYSGSITHSATGWSEIALTTPFVRTAGNNLQVLMERFDGVTHAGFVWNSANGNNTGSTLNTTRRYNGAAAVTVGTTSLTISAFRQAMRFAHRYNNDARAVVAYTLGKIPVPNGTPNTITANISNDGLNAISNLNVTLTVTGANSFSNTKTIASLASLGTTNVTFDPFTPTNEGNNTVTVSVTSDDFNGNNSFTMTQVVNKNTWSYAYGTTPAGGVGFNGATGDFVARFNTNAPTSLSQVSVNFSAGGQPYRIGIWDATGAGGTPGTLLWESASQTSVSGVNVLPVSPVQNIPAGDFFVGVRQTGTTNVSFSYQTETPIRGSTFYFVSPSGGTTWTDFAPNNSFRFMIEPKLILPVDAGVSNLGLPATITCYSTPQTFNVTLTNAGANAILPGSASLTLKIRGANTYTNTVTNSSNLPTGGTEVISFTGINLSNGGTNFDTLYVNLAGDPEKANDTIKSSHITASTISGASLPLIEGFEGTLNIGYLTVVSGRNLVLLQNGTYNNVDLGNLPTHSGNRMIVFDNYGGANSSGMVNRLFSNCINIPGAGAGQCGTELTFWMSHDTTYTSAGLRDSLYVSVSTNGGSTWTRLTPGYARIDPAFVTPGWRKETINLAAYAGQKIQIGFENVSKYGNIIALDDVSVGSTATQNATLNTVASNGINLQKGCDDRGWTYYVDPANPNQYLFGIEWDPLLGGNNVAAKAAAIPRLQLNPANYAATDIPTVRATYTMRRYWNVNLNGSTMDAPVNVRFFYDTTEKNSVNAAAAAFALANGGALEPPIWFKTNGVDFTPGPALVIPTGIHNADSVTDVNTTAARYNGVLFAQFNNINSFSGGTYAAGVGLGSVLPVRLVSFNALLNRDNSVGVQWQVTMQDGIRHYVVERSTDGRLFEPLGTVAANTQSDYTYNFTDRAPAPDKNLYRLKIVNQNGIVTYSKIISINLDVKG